MEHLHTMRKAAGLTMLQVSVKLGLTRQQISRLEHGTMKLSHDTACKWADACGFTCCFALKSSFLK